MSRARGRVAVLLLLAPVCGEVLSGSTPILDFVKPPAFVLEIGLYGLGALLVRELVRSRGLGWTNVLLLGAAYGVLEEGLVVTSWINPYWPDAVSLGDRGRALDVSWIWASGLTVYHAIVSIAIPIVLADALFPSSAREPWLSLWGQRVVSLLLALVSLVELALIGFALFRDKGYAPPAGGYLLALGIAATLVVLGLRRWRPSAAPARAPSLWRLRAFAFAMTVAFFGALWASPFAVPVGIGPVLLIAAVTWFALSRVRRWSADPGWGAPPRLALASGTLAFLLLLAPLFEAGGMPSGKDPRGMTLFALATLAFLVWLARRAATRPASVAVATGA